MDVIQEIANRCIVALNSGNKILFCGNGGSAADSQHLAAELVGRFKKERRSLASIALTTDTSILTAVANDYDFDSVFARQVEGLGRSGDVLIGISTSGNSKNVVKAMEMARNTGMHTIAFTGEGGGKLAELCDLTLAVPSTVTARIQEMHILVVILFASLSKKVINRDREEITDFLKGRPMITKTVNEFLTNSLPNLKIAVIGDVMVDRYVFGDVSRISPEAPVPVNRVSSVKEVLGGAGNVASNLANLDCHVYLGAVAGVDDHGRVLDNLLVADRIDTSGLIYDKVGLRLLKCVF